MNSRTLLAAIAAGWAMAGPVFAAGPRLDADTCTRLKTEEATLRQSGIAADMQKGPEWAKANLSTERLGAIEHFIALQEQLMFGCREAQITPEIEKAAEAAKAIEANPTTSTVGGATKPKVKVRRKTRKAPDAQATVDGAIAPNPPGAAPQAGAAEPGVEAPPPAKSISPRPPQPAKPASAGGGRAGAPEGAAP